MNLNALAASVEAWNKDTFEWINTGLANPLFDVLMPLLRQPYTWIPVYAFLGAFFIYNFRKQSIYIILFILFTFLISDQLSAHLLKPLLMHPRPCADVSMANRVRLLIPCGAGYSFPSAHATNHFALSFFLISILGDKVRWLIPAVILWAIAVCFAQIYVGIHYPVDVIGGGIIGSFIGYWTGQLCRMTLKYEPEKPV